MDDITINRVVERRKNNLLRKKSTAREAARAGHPQAQLVLTLAGGRMLYQGWDQKQLLQLEQQQH